MLPCATFTTTTLRFQSSWIITRLYTSRFWAIAKSEPGSSCPTWCDSVVATNKTRCIINRLAEICLPKEEVRWFVCLFVFCIVCFGNKSKLKLFFWPRTNGNPSSQKKQAFLKKTLLTTTHCCVLFLLFFQNNSYSPCSPDFR